ncbi:SDR family oxidoreductase [Brenneria roseae]|nr:SDR family oxidoreductase [Brenneria roseae]
MSIQDKTIVIIGGSSGIGLRVAHQTHAAGARHLILGGRNAQRLKQARDELTAQGAQVTTFQVDAHDASSLQDFFAALPVFDHLVSMVGDAMGGGFLDADLTVIRHVIDSKFFANMLIARHAASKLNTGGSLVFTSGTGGRAQDACASYVGNIGINALVEALGVELAPKARANSVCPTWTVTPFWRDVPEEQREATRQRFNQAIPLGRTATMDEVASAYVFLMSNDFVTGQHLAVDGGIMLGG